MNAKIKSFIPASRYIFPVPESYFPSVKNCSIKNGCVVRLSKIDLDGIMFPGIIVLFHRNKIFANLPSAPLSANAPAIFFLLRQGKYCILYLQKDGPEKYLPVITTKYWSWVLTISICLSGLITHVPKESLYSFQKFFRHTTHFIKLFKK